MTLLVAAQLGAVGAPELGGGDDIGALPDDRAGTVESAAVEGAASGLDVPSTEEIRSALRPLERAVPTLLLPPIAYSRHDDSDPLENDARRTVFESVLLSPGTYLTQVSTVTDIPLSTVRYHVRILDGEDLLRTEKIAGKRRVFPVRADDTEALAALNDASTRTVLDAVERLEPATVTSLAAAVGRTPSTVSHHLSRLETSGLVSRERVGQSVSVTLTASAKDRMGADGQRTPG